MGLDAGADRILPDLIDSGQRVHHDHPFFGPGHDVRGEDELAKTLRRTKKNRHKADPQSYSFHSQTTRHSFQPHGGPTGQSVEVIYS